MIEEQVNIVPHVNILLHGGDEYDFQTALAEIIDNSIQNTINNEDKRTIEIKFSHPTTKNGLDKHQIQIWDNGSGMNMEGLKSWATLGISSPPQRTNKTPTKKTKNFEKYLTSDFSRYGVGSKKAIFNIGNEVTLVSKEKNSRWVYEVSLSKSKLEEDFKKGIKWKTNVISRPPKENEKSFDSFTQVTISDIKTLYVDNYDSKSLRRELARIYHYYIFGSKGNIEVVENNDEKDFDDDEDNFIDIIVDGKSIKDLIDDDLETKYLRLGKNPFEFEFKVSSFINEYDPLSLSQNETKKKVFSTVKGIIYYYPYKNGTETLPTMDESDIPLNDRNSGFECFWNGRLLSYEKIPSLPFTKLKKTTKEEVPDVCYRRIKGMIFLDSSFEVSANKMFLCRQTPLCQSLLNYDDRSLTISFKKWLKECHSKYDEEIIFMERDTKTDLNSEKSYFLKIKYGSQEIKKDDKVLLKKPKVIGEIIEIYRDSTCENYGCLFTIKEWNSQDDNLLSNVPISRLDKILTKSEFRDNTSKLKSKLPAYVDIVDTPNVVLSSQRPPSDPVEAGYILKWITVSVFSGEHKTISKSCGMSLKILLNGKEISSTYADKPFKEGKYCFKIQTLITLKESGEYQFKFKSDLPEVKEKIYNLTVLPGNVDVLESENKELQGEIGSKLKDVKINQCDQYGNYVKFEKHENLKIISTSDNFTINDSYSFKVDNDQIVLSGLQINGKLSKDNNTVNIEISKGNILKPLVIKVSLKPGKPFKMKFSEETLKLLENPSPVKKVLPKTTINLFDSFDNQINESFTCRAISSYFYKTIETPLINGEFNFEEKTCLQLSEDVIDSSEIVVEFSLKEDESVQLKHQFKVEASSISPTKVKLIPSSDQASLIKSSHSKESEIQAVVGTEITGWKISLLDESGSNLEMNGVASFSWTTKKELIEKGECILPIIPVIQVLNTITYTIFLGETEIQYKLIITSIKGNPMFIKNTHKNMKKITCGELFSINFAVYDSFSNVFDVLNDKHLYNELDRINPIIEILEKDKKIRFLDKGKLEITNRGTYKLKDIKIVGPPSDFTLIIKDENETIKEEKIELSIEIGRPSLVKVNESTEIEYQILNYGKLPTLYISVHDIFGTIINQIFSFEIVPPNEINLYTGTQTGQIDLQQTNGVFEINEMFIKAEKGKHCINIYTKERDLPPAKLIIDVQLSNHPTCFKIKHGNEQIEDKKTLTKEAGESFGSLELLVIGEDQKPTESPGIIQMTIINPDNEKKIFKSIHQNDVYIFEESSDYVFQKIGKYTMNIQLPLSNLEFEKIVDPQNSIKQKFIIEVKPGLPSYLDVDSDFVLPAISNTPDDINKRSFWEDLSVYVMDNCGNKIEDYQGEVTIRISPSENSPKLEGNLKATFSKGRVKFGRLSVKEKSKGSIGVYKLIFECENLTSKELEFKFFDDAELQEEQNRIQKEIAKLQKEIEKKKNELFSFEKEFKEVKEEYDNIDKQLKENQSVISQFIKNIDSVKEINNSINSLKSKINEKKSEKIRKESFNKDETLERVIELKKEDSGIIGIVAEIGFIDNEQLDKVLSTLVGRFITSVIVKDKNTSDRLRKLFEKSKNQISLIPMDNINKNKNLDENNKLIFSNIGSPEGFIGYAANLIEISPKYPELRYVFYNLYSDTLVFDTYQNGYDFRQGLLQNGQKCQTIITLDNDKIENNGIVYAGKKTESSNRYGQLPFTESSTFKDMNDKKSKLEEYKEILKKKEEFQPKFDKAEKKFKEMKDKLQPPIKELSDKIEKLSSQTISKFTSNDQSKKKRKGDEEEVIQEKSKKKKKFIDIEAEEIPESEEEKEESYLENSQEEEEEEESPKKKKKKKK